MDEVFKALADPSRRQLLDSLNALNGQTLRQLCAGLAMARQSVSKHLAVLEQANLVTAVWRGREKFHYLNPGPINEIAQRWINQYDQARVEALADLKQALEGISVDTAAPGEGATAPDKPEFVYTTYIRTTPELLWRALTEPAFTRRYWFGHTFESDWRTGSTIVVTRHDGTVADDPEQVVLESDPFRRLAYTWFNTADPYTGSGGGAPEPRSKVAFDLEDLGDGLVKLTVVHSGFEPGSGVLRSVTHGWPRVLADLKTLLETGDPTER